MNPTEANFWKSQFVQFTSRFTYCILQGSNISEPAHDWLSLFSHVSTGLLGRLDGRAWLDTQHPGPSMLPAHGQFESPCQKQSAVGWRFPIFSTSMAARHQPWLTVAKSAWHFRSALFQPYFFVGIVKRDDFYEEIMHIGQDAQAPFAS